MISKLKWLRQKTAPDEEIKGMNNHRQKGGHQGLRVGGGDGVGIGSWMENLGI